VDLCFKYVRKICFFFFFLRLLFTAKHSFRRTSQRAAIRTKHKFVKCGTAVQQASLVARRIASLPNASSFATCPRSRCTFAAGLRDLASLPSRSCTSFAMDLAPTPRRRFRTRLCTTLSTTLHGAAPRSVLDRRRRQPPRRHRPRPLRDRHRPARPPRPTPASDSTTGSTADGSSGCDRARSTAVASLESLSTTGNETLSEWHDVRQWHHCRDARRTGQ
jgi:hypothetical protein